MSQKKWNYSNNNNPQINNNNDIAQIYEPNKMNDSTFNYKTPKTFICEGEEKTNNFEMNKDKNNYIICILLKDDSSQGSCLLEITLDGISQSLRTSSIQDLGVSSTNT